MKKILFSCAMLAMTAWAVNAQETSTYCTPTYEKGGNIGHIGSLTIKAGEQTLVDAWAPTDQTNVVSGTVQNFFNVEEGATISLSLTTAAAAWGTFHVYMDLNGDGDLTDVGENVLNIASQQNGSNYVDARTGTNNNITITATAGTYLMRVMSVHREESLTGPCNTYSEGGYADFYFNVVEPQTPDPVFGTAAGTVFKPKSEASITVTAEEGATIYYTTDGTNPTEATQTSITSGEQISLDTDLPWYSAITVKAMAKSDSKTASAVAEATYYVHQYNMPTVATQGLTRAQ